MGTIILMPIILMGAYQGCPRGPPKSVSISTRQKRRCVGVVGLAAPCLRLAFQFQTKSILCSTNTTPVSAKLRNSVGFDDESREVLSYLEYGREGKSRAGLFQATQHFGVGLA
jgi:hypothetical protein